MLKRLFRQLERRLEPLAIPHMTIGIVIVQVIAFAGSYSNPDLIASMMLEPKLVMAGEWWRLFTFVAIPPTSNPLFALFAWYLFWLFGSALEQEWGLFRYDLFLLIGYALTVAASFGFGIPADNHYLGLTVFLAFAMLYPNFELLLFFILPVKVKWLALLSGGLLLFAFVGGEWPDRFMILASMSNFLLFFAGDIYRYIRGSGRRIAKKVAEPMVDLDKPFHRCVVCQRTERDDPQLDFRYAHDETGNVACYCEEHLPEPATADD
jgi:hypothetical protein